MPHAAAALLPLMLIPSFWWGGEETNGTYPGMAEEFIGGGTGGGGDENAKSLSMHVAGMVFLLCWPLTSILGIIFRLTPPLADPFEVPNGLVVFGASALLAHVLEAYVNKGRYSVRQAVSAPYRYLISFFRKCASIMKRKIASYNDSDHTADLDENLGRQDEGDDTVDSVVGCSRVSSASAVLEGRASGVPRGELEDDDSCSNFGGNINDQQGRTSLLCAYVHRLLPVYLRELRRLGHAVTEEEGIADLREHLERVVHEHEDSDTKEEGVDYRDQEEDDIDDDYHTEEDDDDQEDELEYDDENDDEILDENEDENDDENEDENDDENEDKNDHST